MKFSMILGTLNRSEAIQYCLDSLLCQEYDDYEIIIIDQSTNDETEKIVNFLNDNRIIYRHVNYRGLSKARNEALQLATGDYFALIDDDAYYPADYFTNASQLIREHTILSGCITDKNGEYAVKEYKTTKDNSVLSVRQIRRMAPSATLIIPYDLFIKGVKFDNQMGVGTNFGSGEETDFLLQSLDKGYKILFTTALHIIHPTIETEVSKADKIKKIELYAKGAGALIAKDRFLRKHSRMIPVQLETEIKMAIRMSGILGSKKQEISSIQKKGFIEGLKGYKKIVEAGYEPDCDL